MNLNFEVASRIETGKLDGTRSYVLSGQLSFAADDDSEPHVMGQMTFPIPLSLWEEVEPGDVLAFAYTGAHDSAGHS